MAEDSDGQAQPLPPPVLQSARPNPWTWVLLAFVFSLLIYNALASYFGPKHEAQAKPELDLMQLKVEVGFQELLGKILSEAKKADSTTDISPLQKQGGQIRDQLKEEANSLKRKDKLSTEDAKLLLALQTEAKEKPDPRALEVLNKSKDRQDNRVAEIYGSESLSGQAADKLAPQGDDFLDRLIRAQAREKAGAKDARAGLTNGNAVLGLILLAGFAVVASAIGGVVLLLHFVGVQNGARPKGLPVAFMSKAAGDRFALRMAVYLLGFIGVSSVFSMVDLPVDPVYTQVAALTVVLVGVFVMLRVPIFGQADPWTVMRGKKPKQGYLPAALTGWMANFPVLIVTIMASSFLLRFLPTPSHPVTNEISTTSNPLKLGLLLLTASVLAPVIEETCFRGLLFPAITARTGNHWIGMVASGFLFASIHPQGPGLWLALAGLGMLMAYLTYWTGSIVPGMILHGVHNGMILMMGIIINMI